MKRVTKRSLALLLALLISLSAIPAQAAYVEGTLESGLTTAPPTISSRVAALSQITDGTGYVPEQFYDFSDTDGASADEALPASYTSPYVTPAKHQISGNCWAYALTGACESSAMKAGLATMPDYSEWGITYYTYYSQKGLGGGDDVLGARRLARWVGPIDEALAPTEGAAIPAEYESSRDSAHVQAFYVTDKGNIEAVKKLILEYGGVSSGYRTGGPMNTAPDGSNAYYASAEYLNRDHALGNHAIEFIGWNDNYPKEYFSASCRPEHDGAWLVKNSYGAGSGFWMSYEQSGDGGFQNALAVKLEPADNYDSIYYSGKKTSIAVDVGDSTESTGACYTAKGAELLRAVGVESTATDATYTIRVYKGLTGSTPDTGTLVETVTGTQTYIGFETVTLSTPVALAAGERFFLSVSYKASNGKTVTPILLTEDGNGQNGSYSYKNGTWNALTSTCSPITAYTDQSAAKTVTVNLDATGGIVSPSTKAVVQYDVYGALPTPTRSGYTFFGWYPAKDGAGDQVQANSLVKSDTDHTLYAAWAATDQVCTVTLDACGGVSPEATQKVVQGKPYGTLPEPTWAGHTFLGWYGDTAYTGAAVTDTSIVPTTSAQTLYAKWDARVSHTLSFNNCGGTSGTASKTVYNGETYGELPEPTRTGYIFSGWYTEQNGAGDQITFDRTVELTADQTVYAYWTGNMIFLTLDYNDGSSSSDDTIVINGTPYSTATPLPVPTREGYFFAGWYTEKTGGTLITDDGIANLNIENGTNGRLYAHWSETPVSLYAVTFCLNGGYLNSEYTVLSASSEVSTITLPEPTWAGHSFLGWTAGAHGARVGGAGDPYTVTANTTLYAQWDDSDSVLAFPDKNKDGIPDEFQVRFIFAVSDPVYLISDLPNTLVNENTTDDLTGSSATGTWRSYSIKSMVIWKNKGDLSYASLFADRSRWFDADFYASTCAKPATLLATESPESPSYPCQWVQDDSETPLTGADGMNSPSSAWKAPGKDAVRGTLNYVTYTVGADSGSIRFLLSKSDTGTEADENGDGIPDSMQVKFTFRQIGLGAFSDTVPSTLLKEGTAASTFKESAASGTWRKLEDGSVVIFKNKGDIDYKTLFDAPVSWYAPLTYVMLRCTPGILQKDEVPALPVGVTGLWYQDDSASPLTGVDGMNSPSAAGPGVDGKEESSDSVNYTVGNIFGNIVFTAVDASTCPVEYRSNLPEGTTGNTLVVSHSVFHKIGDPVEESPSAAGVAAPKDGYTFDGWFTAAEGGTQITAVKNAQTLYAHWTAAGGQITITPDTGKDYVVLRGIWAKESTKALTLQDSAGNTVPSNAATWRVVSGSAADFHFPADCVSVDAAGTVTALRSGICQVEANYRGTTAQMTVIVPGDYTRDGLLNTADCTSSIDVSLEDVALSTLPYSFALLDVNLDGTINTADVTIITDLALEDKRIA